MRPWDAHESKFKIVVDDSYGGRNLQHLPLRGRIRCNPRAPPTQKVSKLDRKTINEDLLEKLKSSNQFAPLLDLESNRSDERSDSESDFDGDSVSLPTSVLYDKFVETTTVILTESKVIKEPVRKVKSPRLNTKTKATINKRRTLWKDWSVSGCVDPLSRSELVCQIDIVDELIKQANTLKWTEFVQTLTQQFGPEDIKEGWRGIRNAMGNKHASMAGGPVLNLNGDLLTKPTDILERWANHFESLRQEEEVHGASDKFTKLFQERIDQYQRTTLNIPNFDWYDVCVAMRGMKGGKAAGLSLLPLELFRLGCPSTYELDTLKKAGSRATILPHDDEVFFIISCKEYDGVKDRTKTS